jgi:hypothetical protein
MPAEFLPAFIMRGFDRHNIPRWQMVPVNGERWVILRDGAGLTVTSAAPATATITEVAAGTLSGGDRAPSLTGDRFFKIEGKAKGDTTIEAKSGVVTVISLAIGVKNRKTVNLAFNFVKDNAGHSTSRSRASAAGWVKGIHHIYFGQANIDIKLKTARWVTVPQNLGRVVRFSSHLPGVPAAQHEWAAVTAHGDTTADMNIFLVWEYEQDNTPFTDQTDAGTLSNNCIFEDRAGAQLAETFSHEIGHYLGCSDHYVAARKRELMYGITDARGVHIPKADADIMNP